MQHESWPDQPCAYPKARSAMLYRGRTPVAWGWSAQKRLSELSPSQQSEHWYVEDFKLALQDEDKAREIRSKGLTPEQVVADYLQHFIRYTKQELRKSGVPNSELEQPQWCLTVPAMWSESSKSLMRRAALRAGLIRTLEDEALKIILEPEAAALHARDTNAPPLRPGMVVCILDVGGGTADITVHEVVDRGGVSVLAEAVSADGAMCGSQYVDQAFRSHYRDAIGHTVFDNWVDQHPAEWRQVMDKWVTCKHNFTGEPGTERTKYRLPVPPRLLEQLPCGTRDRLSRQQRGVTCPDVVLDSVTMTSLFSGPVKTLMQTAARQLHGCQQKCDLVILVGGFAQSPYLQAIVTHALVTADLTKRVVTPRLPYSAVLLGAVLYGCDPSSVHSRRSRLAYGINSCVPYEPDAPRSSRFLHPEQNEWYSDALFYRFVDKNEPVGHDQVVLHYVSPMYAQQEVLEIPILATDKQELKWLDETDTDSYHRLGSVVVHLPEGVGSDAIIELLFRFGGTEVTVTAQEVNTQVEVHAAFKFATATGSIPAPAPRSACPAGSSVAELGGRPGAGARAPAATTAECGICFEPKPLHAMVSAGENADRPGPSHAAPDCGHLFCRPCMAQHVRAELERAKYPLQCPTPRCGEHLGHDTVVDLIGHDTNLCQVLSRLSTEHALQDGLVYCVYKDCSAMLAAPEPDELGAPLTCPVCDRTFCLECRLEGWHEGMTCAEFQSLPPDMRTKEDAALLVLSQERRWRQCPRCRHMVDRVTGCNHVKCRCGTSFCFGCGSPYQSNRPTGDNVHGTPSCRCTLFPVPAGLH